ncbi:MAG: thermonuclease family protein [Sedimentisphaerales bacterium]
MKNRKIKYAQSRLQRNILLLSVFLFLAAAVWLDRTFHPFLKTSVSTQKTQDTNDWDKYNEKSFIVVKVVDGDTIDINAPDEKWPDTRIRLLAVDTPETDKSPSGAMYFGKEASKFTTDTVLGQPVTVVMDKFSKPRDKYNRLLCFVRLADGRILNEELVSEGFAYADTRFPHSYYKEYIQLEETAKKEKRGLWEKVTPDQMPQWRRN